MFLYLNDFGSVPNCLMEDLMMESFALLTNADAASGVRGGVFRAVTVSERIPPFIYIFLCPILNLKLRGVVAR